MTESIYPNVLLHIGDEWRDGAGHRTLDILNPATGDLLGQAAMAEPADVAAAAESAEKGSRSGAAPRRSSVRA